MAKGKPGRKENRQPSGQGTEPGIQKATAKTHKTAQETQKPTQARADNKQSITKSDAVEKAAPYGRAPDQEVKAQVSAEPKPQRQFKKRTIASNEFRYREDDTYDLDIDEDAVETKDFMYLVNNAGGSTTHFQFADEKAWEESLHQEMSNTDGEVNSSSFLDLNLDRLASELAGSRIADTCRLDNLPTECRYCVEDLRTDGCETSEHLQSEHEEQNTSPVTLSDRFEWTLNGISEFQTFIFGDRSSQLKTAVDVVGCNSTNHKVSNSASAAHISATTSASAVQGNDSFSRSSNSMDELLTRGNIYGNMVLHASEDDSLLDDLLVLPQANTSERSSDYSLSSKGISVSQSRSSEDNLDNQSQSSDILTSQSRSDSITTGDDNSLDELLALSNEVTTEPRNSCRGSTKADASHSRTNGNVEDDLDTLLQINGTSKENVLPASATSVCASKPSEIDDWLADMLNKPI